MLSLGPMIHQGYLLLPPFFAAGHIRLLKCAWVECILLFCPSQWELFFTKYHIPTYECLICLQITHSPPLFGKWVSKKDAFRLWMRTCPSFLDYLEQSTNYQRFISHYMMAHIYKVPHKGIFLLATLLEFSLLNRLRYVHNPPKIVSVGMLGT